MRLSYFSRLFCSLNHRLIRLFEVRSLVIIVFCIFHSCVFGQGYFKETQGIRAAYDNIVHLKLELAKDQIAKIKKEEPNNLLVLHLENYVDFFTVFLNEEKDEFKRLEKNKKIRLRKIEKEGDPNSPYYLFVQAEINLQWALVRAKFDQVLKAASESYNAYKLLTLNQERFPEFIANKKSLSAIHVLVESIPGLVRKLFNIKGSIALGTEEIEEVISYSEKHDFLYRKEAIAIYSYILFHQNNEKDKAWKYLNESEMDPVANPLACFLMSTMAMKLGENDYAIELLENRPQGNEYSTFHYLEFVLGKAKLNQLDPEANIHFKNFLNNFEGQHYIKEAYQKLAWYELVVNNNNVPRYKFYMRQAQKEGEELIDGDKQAQKEAKRKNIPHPILLKARLQYDGGYLQSAYRILIENAHLFSNSNHHEIEYYYRLGRVTQALGNSFDAINYYNLVIQKGENSELYYACNSALQIALIFEGQKNKRQAIRYFERCLDMQPSDYKNSLHQKAKSGLDRVKRI